MNHDKLRQQAEATLSNAGSSGEYILATAVLTLLDKNAALTSSVKRYERLARWTQCDYNCNDRFYDGGCNCGFRKALGDAS